MHSNAVDRLGTAPVGAPFLRGEGGRPLVGGSGREEGAETRVRPSLHRSAEFLRCFSRLPTLFLRAPHLRRARAPVVRGSSSVSDANNGREGGRSGGETERGKGDAPKVGLSPLARSNSRRIERGNGNQSTAAPGFFPARYSSAGTRSFGAFLARSLFSRSRPRQSILHGCLLTTANFVAVLADGTRPPLSSARHNVVDAT